MFNSSNALLHTQLGLEARVGIDRTRLQIRNEFLMFSERVKTAQPLKISLKVSLDHRCPIEAGY